MEENQNPKNEPEQKTDQDFEARYFKKIEQIFANRTGLLNNIKKDFLYGLLVLLPLFITIWLLFLLINLISGPVNMLFNIDSPLLSFLITIIFITIIGIITRNIIGKTFMRYFEKIMAKLPLVNIFYKSSRQLMDALAFQESHFLSCVLVQYPRIGLWTLGFVTKNDVALYDKNQKEVFNNNLHAIFVPTTPNPTSGWILFAEEHEFIRLNISIEEGIKTVISAGVLCPNKGKIHGNK